jgi:PX domain
VNDQENVSVHVSNPVYHDRGMFFKGFTTFSISTQPFNWDVNRRFKDFEWLHACLKNRYCAHVVEIV